MKTSSIIACFLFLLLICRPGWGVGQVDTDFARLPKATRSGLHFSPKEIEMWRIRAQSGPYLRTGDAGINTPDDWARITIYRNQFCRDPFAAGNGGEEKWNLWTGYDVKIDSMHQYPVWQGIKLEAAAFCYLVVADTQAGRLAAQALLQQVRYEPGTRVGLPVGGWPVPDHQSKKPTYESGTKECVWLTRLAFAYDYLQPLYTPAERREITGWFRTAATYFAKRAADKYKGCFPDRAQDSYARRTYLAAPGGVASWGLEDRIYQRPEGKGAWVSQGYLYTHRNADGSLGNRIPHVAGIYSNRSAERMTFIMVAGLLSGDKYLIAEARRYQREWLMFGVFPDGTYGEYNRNGDYGNPSQGALWYGSLCLQSYLLSADMLWRRGDSSLYTFRTRDGVASTAVPAGRPPKSIATVCQRYADNCAARHPIFYGAVDTLNRIDIYNESPLDQFGTRYCTWDYNLALANRYFRNPAWRAVYQRRAPGTVPYPLKGFNSAARVWIPWSGTGAELPGFLFMFGEEVEQR